LHYLLKGRQPIILALATGLKENLEPEIVKPLAQSRLLIITKASNPKKFEEIMLLLLVKK
jgi:accessory colonization factor AcfC